jgi:hypothetical protein
MTTTPIRPFRTPVRGHAFAPRPPDTSGPIPGQLARLIREPGNPADRYAVGVWVADARGRWRIGYLDRGVAARLAPRLDEGAELSVQIDGWTSEPDGRWQRPVVVVVPAPATAVEDDDGIPSAEPPTPQPDAPIPGPTKRRTVASPGLWGRPPGVTRRPVRQTDGRTVDTRTTDPR